MEVVLLKDVRRLGSAGEVRRVADGYARNYLIPRGLAVPATEAVRKRVEEQAAARARREAAEKAVVQQVAADLQNVELVFQAKAGEGGRLYGSVTSADIAAKLSEQLGQPVDKRKVLLEEPIKELGKTRVQVRLHSDVQITVTVLVESEGEGA